MRYYIYKYFIILIYH